MILVPPEGPLDASFVAIGEAPGPEEEKRGRPFIGPSGTVLATGTAAGGISREQMRILNVSPYRIYDDEDSSSRHARRLEQIPALSAELHRCTAARTILLIGAEAVEAALGLCGPQRDPQNPKRKLTPSIFDYHGSTFTRVEALALQAWAKRYGIPTVDGLPPNVHSVVVVLHPAFALRGNMPRFKLSIQLVIGRAAALSAMLFGPTRPPESHFDLCATPEKIEAYLWDRGATPVTVDIETPRDNPKRIILCGVGTHDTQILVAPWDAAYAEVMRKWFRRAGAIVGHNFLYDLRGFAAYDVRPVTMRRIYDTIVACGLLQPVDDEVRDFPWLSLATCVARHVPGFWYWKEVDRTCQQALFAATWPGVPWELQDRLYNGVDVDRNSALWLRVNPILLREGML